MSTTVGSGGWPGVTDERPVSPPDDDALERSVDEWDADAKPLAIQRAWDIYHANQDYRWAHEHQFGEPANLYRLELECAYLCEVWHLPNPLCGPECVKALRNMQAEE